MRATLKGAGNPKYLAKCARGAYFAVPVTRKELMNAVIASYDADVIIYAGPILRPYDDQVISLIGAHKERENVVFWLTTFGGDPTAAYRMARALQQNYKQVIVFVNSSCYSAGTLLALAAHTMIIGQHAEFGPIDVQLLRRDRDEIGERISGLASRSALSLATEETPQTFKTIFLKLRRDLGLSTKLAAEVASNLTDSTIGKLFQQIDPLRLAEDGRSVKMIENYAERVVTANVRPGAIHSLINNYPDHAFVIDPTEAETKIFVTVEKPCDELAALGADLKSQFSQFLYEPDPAVIFWQDLPDPSTPSQEKNETAPEPGDHVREEGSPGPTEDNSTEEQPVSTSSDVHGENIEGT